MKLKSRRRVPPRPPEPPVGVPVVDGEPVAPYELPDDPTGNERQLRQIAETQRRRAQSQRTMFSRGVNAVAEGMRRRRGTVYERTFFNRWTVERRESSLVGEGKRRTLEITFVDRKHMRGVRWNFLIELWRAK